MRTLVFAVLLDLLLWGLIAGTGTSGAGLPTGVEFGFLAVGPPGLGADELVEQELVSTALASEIFIHQ